MMNRFDPTSFQTDKTLTASHRAATGSFYTPYHLAFWMVKTTLDRLVCDYLQKCQQEACDSNILTYLESLKVLEPSCGSGVFACAFFACCESYYDEAFNTPSTEATDHLHRSFKIQTFLNNVYACDIQSDPLMNYQNIVAQAYGIEATHVPVYNLDILSNEQIEDWANLSAAFTTGFDLVLGNPPYLGEKSNKEVFQKIRQTDFGKKYYEGKMDYFYFFAYRAIESLKPGGRLCFVTTNYFPTADGAVKFRQFLKEWGVFTRIINFGEAVLFSDAMGQNNMVWEFEKRETLSQTNAANDAKCLPSRVTIWSALSKKSALKDLADTDLWSSHIIDEQDLYDSHGCMQLNCSKEEAGVLKHLQAVCDGSLGIFCEVNQGIVSGADRDFKNNVGIFALKPEEVSQLKIEDHFIKPFYKSKDVKPYRVIRQTLDYILYLDGSENEEAFKETMTYRHLLRFKERLSKRREVEKGLRPWYALQWPREMNRFNGEKIIVPQRSNLNTFAYTTADNFGSADLYYIAAKSDSMPIPLRALTGYLNSKVVYFWLYYAGKRKGKMLELYSTPLKKIPIPTQWSEALWNELACLTEALMTQLATLPLSETDSSAIEALQRQIDAFLYKHLNLSEPMRLLIEQHYEKATVNR